MVSYVEICSALFSLLLLLLVLKSGAHCRRVPLVATMTRSRSLLVDDRVEQQPQQVAKTRHDGCTLIPKGFEESVTDTPSPEV